jgi:hypothetical protein
VGTGDVPGYILQRELPRNPDRRVIAGRADDPAEPETGFILSATPRGASLSRSARRGPDR